MFLNKLLLMLIGVLLIPNHAVAQSIYTNALGMSFQNIPGNVIFQMGEVTTDPNGVFWDSAPAHPVKISEAYLM